HALGWPLQRLTRCHLLPPAAQPAHVVAVPALDQQHGLAEVLLVHGPVDRQHAGPEAALDLVLDARAAAVLEDGVAAGAEGKHLADGVERLPHRRGAREGPEVAAAALPDLPGHQDAGPGAPPGP